MSPEKEPPVSSAHMQRLEVLSHIAAGVSHEINSPVQFISDNATFARRALEDLLALTHTTRQLLDSPCSDVELRSGLRSALAGIDLEFLDEEMVPAFEAITHGLERITGVGRDVRAFARPAVDAIDRCNTRGELELALELCRRDLALFHAVHVDIPAELPSVPGRPGAVCEILVNVLMRVCRTLRVQRSLAPSDGPCIMNVRAAAIGETVAIEVCCPEFLPPSPVEDEAETAFKIVHAVLQEHHGGHLRLAHKEGDCQCITIVIPTSAGHTQ